MKENIIYGLFDPRDGQLRYIGKSVNGLKRPEETKAKISKKLMGHPANLGSGRPRNIV